VSQRRLLRDRIIAVVVLIVLFTRYIAPLFYLFFPFGSTTWIDVLDVMKTGLVIVLLQFYIIEGYAHSKKQLRDRVGVDRLAEGMRETPEIAKTEAARISVATYDAPLGLHHSIYLVFASEVIAYLAFISNLTVLSLGLSILAVVLLLAALVNAIGLFVVQKWTEVSVFYDQIMIHIPDETAIVIAKADLTSIRIAYPKKSFWKPYAPRPMCEFVTTVPLVAIELAPKLALALRDFGYGRFVETPQDNQPAPIVK
jgi:hypothetical protein